MTYIISGLNGSLEKYNDLKKQAKITENDTVYPVGGLAEGDLTLLAELSMCVNVYPVMGRSDWTALRMLGGFERMLKDKTSPDAEYIENMKKWMADGGQEVLDSYRELDDDMKEGLLDYLGEFSCFEEIVTNKKNYMLIPAGIKQYSTKCDVYDLEPEDFLEEALDPEKEYFAGKTVITADIGRKLDTVTRINNNICIGCTRAVCLRLEDMAEFYA